MWNIILTFLGNFLSKTVQYTCQAIASVFGYMLAVKKDQIQKEKEKNKKQRNDNIEDVCDNGNLKDLIDLGTK